LARELAQANIVVVSGLAEGIDTEALSAAMEAGGRVVAVIGTPLDKAYPQANAALQEAIYRDHLVVSQFEVGSRVFKSNFPRRNRLMAALSAGTAIIEAQDDSGSMHQAWECLKLDRWLFIPRSAADDPSLTWPAKFLKYGRTKVFSSTEDILGALP
jgi:DNA processing protein